MKFPNYKSGSRMKFKVTNDSVLSKDVLTESDVHLLMRRINADNDIMGRMGDSASKIVDGLSSRDGGYVLTPEQVEKGRAWLNKHRKDMGAREEEVMDNFQTIRLIGTAPGEYNNYQYPYYEVRSKPDPSGHASTFAYKVEGGQLHILG